jgi:hypothetical protein
MFPGKRKYYRITIEVPCQFRIVDGKNPEEMSPFIKGLIQDMSLGGVQFGTDVLNHGHLYIFNEFGMKEDADFKPNVLLVKFSLPEEKEPFVFYCEPRWRGEGGFSDPFKYSIGAKYIRARKEDLVGMRDYIQRHGDKKFLLTYAKKREEAKKKHQLQGIVPETQSQYYALAELELRYKIISGQDKKHSRIKSARTRNLSISGLCAVVEDMDIDNMNMSFDEDPLKRNSIFLEIFIPGQKKPVIAIGEVHWFERLPRGGKYNYNVGIKFSKIAEDDKMAIAGHIIDKPPDGGGLKSY